MSGILGLAILVADIYAAVNIYQSRESTGAKVAWTVLIVLLPVLGFIIWFMAGPRSRQA
ncbi:MAG: PLD nuclease N-terminal domain-containing protein [Gemmatimonadota bacterium]